MIRYSLDKLNDVITLKTDTIATLRNLSGIPNTVYVTGYYTANDNAFGSNFFKWNPVSTASDNGGTIIKLNNIDTGRYELQYSGPVNVLWFGADPTGATDSTQAIQAAINSIPAIGGTVYIPSGKFSISNTINIGDGTNSAGSTKNAIKLVGQGITPYMGDGIGTELMWTGASGGIMMSFNGTGDGYGLDNIRLNANSSAANCINIYSVRLSSFTNFSLQNFTSVGLGLYTRTGSGVKYSSGNIFNNFIITSSVSASNNVIGIDIAGDYSNNNDWHRNTFIDGIVQIQKQSSNTAYAGYFKFADHNVFMNVDFNVSGSSGNGFGIMLDGSNNNSYPQNFFFYGGSISSVTTNEGSSSYIGNNSFFGFTTADSETIPTHPKLGGVTDTGILFGTFYKHLGINSRGYKGYSSSATLTSDDLGRAIYYQGNDGTLTLPPAAGNEGGVISVFNIAGGGVCSLARSGSDTIYALKATGGSSVNLYGGDSISLVSQGSIWYQLGANLSTDNMITVTTSSYTVVAEDSNLNVYYSGTVTITMPDASKYKNRKITIKTVTANSVVSSSSNIVGMTGGNPTTSILPATAGKWITLISNGTNWEGIMSNLS
jgi:hypothetical protein